MKSAIDPAWEKIHSERTWGMYPTEHVIRFVARNYYKTDRKNTRILDFGCGSGAHTWYLSKEGFDTYGFDGAPSAIKRAEEILKEERLYANLSVQDAISLSYEDNFFDSIIDNVTSGQNLMPDIEKMYDEVFRCLKPGGKYFNVSFGQKTTGYGTGTEEEPGTFTNMVSDNFSQVGRIHFFTHDEIAALLEKHGFQVIQKENVLYTDNGHPIEHLITVAVKP